MLRFLGFLIIPIDLVLLCYGAYLYAYSAASSAMWIGVSSFIYSISVFPIAGIIGIVLSIFMHKKRTHDILATLLLLISICMTTVILPASTIVGLSSIFNPIAKINVQTNKQRKKLQTREIYALHYRNLLKEFSQKKRILDISSYYVLVEGNKIIVLESLRNWLINKDRAKELNEYINRLVYKRPVSIILPDFDNFSKNYTLDITPIFSVLKNNMPVDPDTGTLYGKIPAKIFIDNESLDNLILKKYMGIHSPSAGEGLK